MLKEAGDRRLLGRFVEELSGSIVLASGF